MVPLLEKIFTLMQSPLLLFISLLFISILFLSVKRRNFLKNPGKLIPSPPKLPFIGNIHQLSSQYHQSLYLLSLEYGHLMLLRLGEVSWLIVSSSDMACSIMRTHDLTFASRPSAVVSDILRLSDVAFEPYGEDWRQLKKIFTIHLLSNKKNTSYRTLREYEVSKLIANINNHASSSSGDPIELSKILFSCMIDLICRVVSGKFIMEDQRYALVREVVEENFLLLGRFIIGDLYSSLAWLEELIGLSKRATINRNKWDKLLEELIQAHIQNEENEEPDNFVDILLSLKNDSSMNFELTMNQMKGLLVDAFAGGIDTTYIIIDWAMLLRMLGFGLQLE